MKKLVILLLTAMCLAACGQDKENDQGAVYMTSIKEFGGIIDWPYETQ